MFDLVLNATLKILSQEKAKLLCSAFIQSQFNPRGAEPDYNRIASS